MDFQTRIFNSQKKRTFKFQFDSIEENLRIYVREFRPMDKHYINPYPNMIQQKPEWISLSLFQMMFLKSIMSQQVKLITIYKNQLRIKNRLQKNSKNTNKNQNKKSLQFWKDFEVKKLSLKELKKNTKQFQKSNRLML